MVWRSRRQRRRTTRPDFGWLPVTHISPLPTLLLKHQEVPTYQNIYSILSFMILSVYVNIECLETIQAKSWIDNGERLLFLLSFGARSRLSHFMAHRQGGSHCLMEHDLSAINLTWHTLGFMRSAIKRQVGWHCPLIIYKVRLNISKISNYQINRSLRSCTLPW